MNPENQPLSTEEMILEAAEREFLSKGYAGARTSSIAEAAGVNHAMLHYYFRTKEKLFEKIVERKMSYIGNLIIGTIDDSDMPLFEKVACAVGHHFDFIAANPLLPGFLIGEVFGYEERLPKVTDVLISKVPDAVARLQAEIDRNAAQGLCRRADARMLLLDMVSLNIFPFMAWPMISTVLLSVNPDEDKAAFLERRKKENIETILMKLRP